MLFKRSKVVHLYSLFLSLCLHLDPSTSFQPKPVIVSTRTTAMPPRQDETNLHQTLHSSPLISDAPVSDTEPLRIGFLGCGTIASAICTGLCTQSRVPIHQILVTRRSEKRSSALVQNFPDLVRVEEEAQQILNESDIIFCCVLPEQTSELLQSLEFDASRHRLISLVSTSTLEGLRTDSKLPDDQVAKMICLPAVAQRKGVSLVVPEQTESFPILLKTLQALGGYVECQDEDQMRALMVPTGLMGAFYGMLQNTQQWLVQKGVSPEDASYFVASQYHAMAVDSLENLRENPNRFQELIDEQTPGGLNEQGLQNLAQQGAWEAYDNVMNSMYDRISGVSDGSLKSKEIGDE